MYMSAVYSQVGVTESLDEPTEVVGLTGLSPAEDGGVQMGSSAMKDKLNDICNGANTLCEFLVSVS